MQNRCSFPDSKPQEPNNPWPFRDPAQTTEFERLCREALSAGGRDVRIVEGYALVAGQPGVHGLRNLAEHCAQLPQSMWENEIREHLALSAPERLRAIEDQVCNGGFESNASKLVVRLYPDSSSKDPGVAGCVHREDIPGLCTVLAVDMDRSIVGVPRALADAWGQSDDALFARALQNLPKHCTGKPCGFVLPKPMALRFEFLEGGPYAAASALRFDDLPLPKGRHGNLIGLPVRDSLISWAIDSWPSDDVLGSMFSMAHGRNGDGPYPVTRHIYWRRPDGVFEMQRSLPTSRGLRLVASTGFAQLRARLRP